MHFPKRDERPDVPALADLAVYDSRGRLTAIAEVKNKLGTSADWAAKTRRNLLDYGDFGNVGFFLIVTPDKIYLWKDAGTAPVVVPPTHVADTGPEFEHYFKGIGTDREHVSRHAFELIVSGWLGKVVYFSDVAEDYGHIPDWISESGLLDAVKDGRMEHEVAV